MLDTQEPKFDFSDPMAPLITWIVMEALYQTGLAHFRAEGMDIEDTPDERIMFITAVAQHALERDAQ